MRPGGHRCGDPARRHRDGVEAERLQDLVRAFLVLLLDEDADPLDEVEAPADARDLHAVDRLAVRLAHEIDLDRGVHADHLAAGLERGDAQ